MNGCTWLATLLCVCFLEFTEQRWLYFEMCSRKLSHSVHRCAPRQPAARSHVQCLTKPPRVDYASRTCAAVMAARESKEDNKWTPEKRFKGETDKVTTRGLTTAASSTFRLLSCLPWLVTYLARRCVCFGAGFLDGTHIHTRDNKLSIHCAYHTCLLWGPPLVQF